MVSCSAGRNKLWGCTGCSDQARQATRGSQQVDSDGASQLRGAISLHSHVRGSLDCKHQAPRHIQQTVDAATCLQACLRFCLGLNLCSQRDTDALQELSGTAERTRGHSEASSGREYVELRRMPCRCFCVEISVQDTLLSQKPQFVSLFMFF